ncbi:unnamed protein product, partial [Rotaria sordida]
MHTIFKESIFDPIRLEFSSSTIGALTTFIINGLLHVHICFVSLDAESSLFEECSDFQKTKFPKIPKFPQTA